jgi:hypothetical protein
MGTDDQKRQGDPQHIREDAHATRPFVFHPEDNDLFVRTGRQIIADSRLGISVQVWFEECQAMFTRVREWLASRSEGVSACYAVPRGAGMGLFFVPRQDSFDFDLADQIVELNVELERSFNVGPVETHQVPACELDRFIVSGTAHQVYPHAQQPHSTMAS